MKRKVCSFVRILASALTIIVGIHIVLIWFNVTKYLIISVKSEKIKVPMAKFRKWDVFLDSKTSLPSSPLTTWWIIIFGSLQLLTLGFRQFVTLDKATFLQESSVKRTNSKNLPSKVRPSQWTLCSDYGGKAPWLVLDMF